MSSLLDQMAALGREELKRRFEAKEEGYDASSIMLVIMHSDEYTLADYQYIVNRY
ncbi:MAG: hypothetical protein HFJ51_06880 [Clostridia bacterium]|nr:hypothetical protein [Clostridia bacterium]